MCESSKNINILNIVCPNVFKLSVYNEFVGYCLLHTRFIPL